MAFNIPLRIKNLIRKAGSANPYDIAAYLNIAIFPYPLIGHANGFWRRVLRRKYIVVNSKLEEWQQKAVIAHEIGHILLHPKYRHFCLDSRTYFCSRRHEDEADNFSTELLQYACPDIEQKYVKKFLKDGWK